MFRTLGILGVVIATAGVGRADCPGRDGAAFAGIHDFTTVVLGANRTAAIGVNGYYRMIVQPDGCKLNVGIVKLGFTGKMFPADRLQYGTFEGKIVSVPSGWQGPESALFVDAELASEAGSPLSVGFTFIGDTGMWRYLGDSWATAGMWGGLESQTIASSSLPFQAKTKLRCSAEVLKTDTTVGAAIACSDLLIANARLDRVLQIVPYYRDNLGDSFRKIAQAGRVGNLAYVDYCTEYVVDHESPSNGTKSAFRLLIDGVSVRESQPAPAAARKCGVRTRPTSRPPAGRWDGKIQ